MINAKYNFENLGEEKLIFINQYIIDVCQKIDPKLDVNSLSDSKRLTAVQGNDHQFHYYFDRKYPLLFLDLKLLIEGV